MHRILCLMLTGLTLTGLVLWAQEKKPEKNGQKPSDKPSKVELKWSFKQGDKFYQKMNTRTEQSLKIQNQDVKQEQEQEFVFSWQVKSAAAEKVELEQKIESVSMRIRIGSNEISYNSASKDQPENPVASFFKPLIGASFTIALDPKTNRVVSVQGREDFVKRLRDANPNMSQLLGQILSEEQMKQMAEPAFAVTPPEPVVDGASWERKADLTMGPLGSYEATYTYTYRGKEKKGDMELDRIDVQASIKYKPPKPEQASGLPFKIEGGNLEAREVKGVIYFDGKKGRSHSSEMVVNLTGKLTISVGDQKAEVELNQKQTTKTETLDSPPQETKKP